MPDVLNANGESKKDTMPKPLTVSIDLLNAVLQYLGTRPFQEVNQLISGLQAEASPQIKEAAEVMDVTGAN